MKSPVNIFLYVVLLVLSAPQAWAVPDSNPDPNATVVYLRSSCNIANSSPGLSPVENCFETMGALQSWIYSRPNLSAKLLIDIGPGTFTSGTSNSGFQCVSSSGMNGGDLTFRGAGTDKTTLTGMAYGVFQQGCTNTKWAFENLTIQGLYSVVWYGGGISTWTNVVFLGAWFDAIGPALPYTCPVGQQGTHRFFSSRVVAVNSHAPAYNSYCGDGWFWGSEIINSPSINSAAPITSAIFVTGAGNRLHLYGSNVRAEALAGDTAARTMAAINATNGAEVHSHGVGIDLIGNPGWTLVGLDASTNAEIHANESSYFVMPKTGVTFRRIANTGGHVHAPYLWEHIPTQSFSSVDGADMTTVLGTSTSDLQPHMVIYSATCASTNAAKPWWDSVDRVCR